MLVLQLVPSIFWCGFPIFLQLFCISIIYSFNLLWINHQHNDSLDIIIGCSFGQSLFIIFCESLLISITKPLHELTLIALSYRDFINVGIFLQRSFLITNILFIIIALLFYWSHPILTYIFNLIHNKNIINSSIINITSNYLLILLCGLYPLCIYYNIQQFLFSQNLVKYTLCIIGIFAIFAEFFTLNIFNNNNNDSYIDDIVSLSITFLVQCIIITSLLILYCCGCNRSTLKSKILRLARPDDDEQYNYLLDGHRERAKQHKKEKEKEKEKEEEKKTIEMEMNTKKEKKKKKGGPFNDSSPISNQSDIDSVSSMASMASTIIENPWFHVPTWKGWDIKQMFNFEGIRQILTLCIKQIIINCLHQWSIYFILIFISSIISINSFIAQILTFNIMNILIVIPISLSYGIYELIDKYLDHDQSYKLINDLWDTIIALWLFIICILIIIIYVFTEKIIKLYLPLYDEMIYNDLQNISIPWMCLFIILYGLIIINHGIFKCIGLELKGYGLLNSFIFIIIGIPLCFWLISNNLNNSNIPHLISSLNGIWFSLCICCVVILSFSIYKRCTINWRYQSKQYIKRKIKKKQQYRYDIQLQKRYNCCLSSSCCYCYKHKSIKIHNNQYNEVINDNNSNSSNNISSQQQSIDTETATTTTTTTSHSVYYNKYNKHKKKKKKKRKQRALKQVRSWSSLDGNPYYQSSDCDLDSTLNTIDNDDTLLLKTDSEEEQQDDDDDDDDDDTDNDTDDDINDTLEQYGDGLDALDDDDEEYEEEEEEEEEDDKKENNLIVNNNNNNNRIIVDDDDDNNSITTMDSMEDEQMLNDLQSDSSSIQQTIGD